MISHDSVYSAMSNSNMKRRTQGSTDSTKSYDRIITFNSQASDKSSRRLCAEEKACLTFLEETIDSMVTEDGALFSDDAQSSGSAISKNHHVSYGVHQDRSSCDSFPVTGSSQDLSAEEKACLRFLEEAIDSIEDDGLSTDDAESLPESKNVFGKKHCTDHMKNYMIPTPLVLAASNVNISPKQGTAFPNEKQHPGKDNSQPSYGNASHRGPLSDDGLVELCKRVSMIKTSPQKRPATHGDQKYSEKTQNLSESRCAKPDPPAVAPKPKIIPPHTGSLNHRGTTIPNPDSILHRLSSSPDNYGLIRPDKVKLEALSKLGLLKEDAIPESRQGMDAPLSSSFPGWTQKDQLEKSGMKLEGSVSDDERSALQKLSHTLSLSLPKAPDVDEDRRWALRKLGLLKD